MLFQWQDLEHADFQPFHGMTTQFDPIPALILSVDIKVSIPQYIETQPTANKLHLVCHLIQIMSYRFTHQPVKLAQIAYRLSHLLTADMIRGVTEGTEHDTKWEDTMNECVR
jgi:hypothetical protein